MPRKAQLAIVYISTVQHMQNYSKKKKLHILISYTENIKKSSSLSTVFNTYELRGYKKKH